ncbi:MAG: MFS transporter [Actinobacteria bacterium]|nr:MFS transporter [Actinomycetota bacterium]
MRDLLRRRDLRLLLAGQSLSMYGDWMMIIALGVWARVLTGSNAEAGIVFLFLAVTGLIAPLGGLVVDRLPKRPLMIATHLALAGVMCLLLLVHTRAELWLLYTVTALYGLGGDIFGAARSSMLKAMLPDEQLGEANGILQSVREGLRIVAPVSGAGLFAAFGGHVVALVDAATFLGSAATLVALPFAEPEVAPREHHFLREATAGIAHIARTKVLRELTIGLCAALAVIGFCETLIFAIVINGLHRSAPFVGVVDTFQGVGAIAGGLTASALMRRLGDIRLAGLGLVLFGLACFGFLVPSLGAVLPAAAVFGVGVAQLVVAAATAYQRRSPQVMQGRVAAASNMLFSLPQTVSIGLGAVLITLIEFRIEIVIMALIVLASAAYLLTRRDEEAAVSRAASRVAVG